MDTIPKKTFNAAYNPKNGVFIIEKGDREFPFSKTVGRNVKYRFCGDDDAKAAEVILFLVWGFAFLGKINDGKVQKETIYIKLDPWNLDEGFYLLKEMPQDEKGLTGVRPL